MPQFAVVKFDMRQIVVNKDFTDAGRVIGPGFRCQCGNWRYPVRWGFNDKIQEICTGEVMELSCGSWQLLDSRTAILASAWDARQGKLVKPRYECQ